MRTRNLPKKRIKVWSTADYLWFSGTALFLLWWPTNLYKLYKSKRSDNISIFGWISQDVAFILQLSAAYMYELPAIFLASLPGFALSLVYTYLIIYYRYKGRTHDAN